MADLTGIHQALVEDYRETFEIAAGKLLAQPNWTLEATVVLMHLHNGAVTIGPVRSLPLWLDHLPPELDAFVRLQEQGVNFEEAYAQCLAEQGQAFVDACEAAKRSKPLVTHDNLAELTALSQRGFAREPRELLALGNQVWIANLRYRDSVEDKVHLVLAERLQAIHELFGQIPDTLEDVWVKVALNDEAEIAKLIDQTTATRNPFDKKYSKVEDAAWETCASVLNPISVRELMEKGWG